MIRTSKSSATFKDVIKVLFMKKSLINELCSDFGEPYGVYSFLKKISSMSSLLKWVLKKDLEHFKKINEEWQLYEKERMMIAEDTARHAYKNKCICCDMGNGEGGCTIPGYCSIQ